MEHDLLPGMSHRADGKTPPALYGIREAGGGRLDPDTVVSEGSWDAVTAGAGCVLDGVDMAFDGRAPHVSAGRGL